MTWLKASHLLDLNAGHMGSQWRIEPVTVFPVKFEHHVLWVQGSGLLTKISQIQPALLGSSGQMITLRPTVSDSSRYE